MISSPFTGSPATLQVAVDPTNTYAQAELQAGRAAHAPDGRIVVGWI